MNPSNARAWRHRSMRHPKHQRGVVLLIALIAVVLLLIAGLATLRAVDNTTMVTGNLAFREGALQSSDGGVEFARGSLVGIHDATAFFGNPMYTDTTAFDSCTGASPPAWCTKVAPATIARGYFPTWDNSFNPKSEVFSAIRDKDGSNLTWAKDGIVAPAPPGYQILYVVHRLCERPGNFGEPTDRTNCYVAESIPASGSSQTAIGFGEFKPSSTIGGTPYYRITARVTGPRNSVAYVQALMY